MTALPVAIFTANFTELWKERKHKKRVAYRQARQSFSIPNQKMNQREKDVCASLFLLFITFSFFLSLFFFPFSFFLSFLFLFSFFFPDCFRMQAEVRRLLQAIEKEEKEIHSAVISAQELMQQAIQNRQELRMLVTLLRERIAEPADIMEEFSVEEPQD